MIDMYLNIDGVKGESQDDKHKEWIEVLSYSHAMSLPVSSSKSSAGGGTTGRTQHGDLRIKKYVDIASPKLYEAVSKGTHYKTVTFEMCRAGGSQVPFMTITLGQAIVSHVQQNGPEDEDGTNLEDAQRSSLAVSNADLLPTETINFNYGTIEWKYTQQKRTDGSGGGSVSTKFDLTAGK